MTFLGVMVRGNWLAALRNKFRSRDLFFHDGSTMRRVHVSGKLQFGAAALGSVTIALSLFSAVQIAMGTPAVATAIGTVLSANDELARMNAKVVAMQTEMATIREQAARQAQRIEARQAALDAMVTGQGAVPTAIPAASVDSPKAAALVSPLASVEARQDALALRILAMNEARYRATSETLGRVGLTPARFHQVKGAMGGPFEPVPNASGTAKGKADPQFRALFQSWKRLEQLQQGIVAIPSQRPVDSISFTSGFGVRSDPFRGGAAMHAGVDIPGPVGTPIYATADGVVGRAQWANGYGNLVELDHGKGIQTRYGHLSAILVQPGARVTRGQLIGRMGSTGRSTGSHLHYEVRLDGHAVNPMPFLQSANYLMAMQTRGAVAQGGPAGE